MIKRDTKKTKIEKKSNFLNADQRKELKRRLTEKFTKIYGLCNPGRVKEIIENFFADNSQLNSQKLAELENFIKKDALKYKSLAKKKSEVQEPPQEPLESQLSHEPEPQQSHQQSVSDDMDEKDDHHDSVGMYQALMLKQEQELAKQRKILQQKAIKTQLDSQIQEKNKKMEKVKFEHSSYVNAENKMLMKHKEKAAEEEKRRKAEKEHLKEMQLKAIEERNRQLEQEKLKEKQLEDKIVGCLQEDLSRQKQLQILRAEEKKKEMHQLMIENEERKRKREEAERKNRQEEIELQKLANDVQDEIERRRMNQQQQKHDKIQQLLSVGEKVVKTQQDKNQLEEQKIQKYHDKKNREAEKKEKRMKELELANRNKYKDFLDQQIKEKEVKMKGQEDYVREQADIWKRGDQVYSGIDLKNKENTKVCMKQYKEDLERQIKEKEEREKKKKQQEKPNEELMKLNLLTKIQELDIKKRVLADQLNNKDLIGDFTFRINQIDFVLEKNDLIDSCTTNYDLTYVCKTVIEFNSVDFDVILGIPFLKKFTARFNMDRNEIAFEMPRSNYLAQQTPL